jgi:hypothetical protein
MRESYAAWGWQRRPVVAEGLDQEIRAERAGVWWGKLSDPRMQERGSVDALHPRRIRLRHFMLFARPHLVKRMKRFRFVQEEERIVTPGQVGRHIVAVALKIGMVDHADRAMPANLR